MNIDVHTSPQDNEAENTGIGDALIAMPALFGLQQRYPDAYVRLIAKEAQFPWAKLFWNNIWIGANNPPVEAGDLSFRTCSTGHWSREDLVAKSKGLTRLGLICERFGVSPRPIDGLLIDTEYTEKFPFTLDEKPLVVMSAASYGPARIWPAAYFVWLAIDLIKLGFKVVFLGPSNLAGSQEASAKKSGILFLGNLTPQTATMIIASSKFFVGNDSGMAHVAGLLRVPSVVVCGPTIGSLVFGDYTSIDVVQSQKECSGCCLQPAVGFSPACRIGCAALFETSHKTILEKILKRLNLPEEKPVFKIL